MSATYWDVGTLKTYATITDALSAMSILYSGNISSQGVNIIRVYAGGVTVGSASVYREYIDLTSFTGFGSSDYIVIQGMVNHNGIKYTGIEITGGTAPGGYVVSMGPYCRIENVAVARETGHGEGPVVGLIGFNAGGLTTPTGIVYNCMVYDLSVNTPTLIGGVLSPPDFGNLTILNSIACNIVNTSTNSNAIAGGFGALGGTVFVYNCSVHNISVPNSSLHLGIGVGSGGGPGVGVVCTNVVTGTCSYNGIVSGPGAVVNFCVSKDVSAGVYGGSGNKSNQDLTTQIKFTTTTVGSEYLLTTSGSVCNLAGTNLTTTFSNLGYTDTDIAGNARTSWTIGAFNAPVGPVTYDKTIDSVWHILKIRTQAINSNTTLFDTYGGGILGEEVISRREASGYAVDDLHENDEDVGTRPVMGDWEAAPEGLGTVCIKGFQDVSDGDNYLMFNHTKRTKTIYSNAEVD